MSRDNKLLGRIGEDAAAEFLAGKGYRILRRNVRTPFGELDLIAADGACTVFVEVKTRRGRSHGLPEEAVNARKQRHLLDSAQYFLQSGDRADCPWRIDVVAVEYGPAGELIRIEAIEDAVRG